MFKLKKRPPRSPSKLKHNLPSTWSSASYSPARPARSARRLLASSKSQRLSFLPSFSQTALISVIFFISLFGLAYWTLHISQISCTLDDTACPPVINSELNRYYPNFYLNLDLDGIVQKILDSNPQHASAAFRYVFPQSLHLHITSALPLAQISSSTDSAWLVVSSNHKLTQLSASPSADLLSVIWPQAKDLHVGDTVDSGPIKGLVLLAQELEKNYLSPRLIFLHSPLNAQVHLFGDVTVSFDPTQSLSPQITKLQLILNQYPQSTLSHIDVRLDKPVVTFR